MTWTYDTTLSTDLSRVRFKIGDTVAIDPLFTDEEIQALLDDGESVLDVAIELLDSLVMRYARLVNMKSSDTQKDASKLHEQYQKQLDKLLSESQAGSSIAVGVIGGLEAPPLC